MNPAINQKKAIEIQAKVAGFTDDEIKELMDTSEFGNAKLMSECARDIELLLEGKYIEPNANANNAYKQKMVDYMKDHKEDMTQEQFDIMANYIVGIDQIINRNMVRQLNQFQIDQLDKGAIVPETSTLTPDGGQGMENNINPVQQYAQEEPMGQSQI